MKATWNGAVIAESDDTVVVEGNHYFPESALRREYVTPSDHRSHCPWKGEARYHPRFGGSGALHRANQPPRKGKRCPRDVTLSELLRSWRNFPGSRAGSRSPRF
jgi:hypothetical protein